MNDSFADRLDAWLKSSPETVAAQEGKLFDRVIAPNAKAIVLYGAGFMGKQALGALRSAGIEPLAFADDRSDRRMEGFAVVPPEEIARRYPGATVFVTILLPHAQFVETANRLKRLGCGQIFSGTDLFHALKQPYFYLDLPHKVLLAGDEIKRALSLFSDEPSRREFLTQIGLRLNLAVDAPPALPLAAQYQPGDLFLKKTDEAFVDCGAFDGDTVEAFLRWQQGSFARVLALEPDRQNFSALQDRLARMPAAVREKIAVAAVAVGASDGTVRFSPTGTAEARLSSDQHGYDVPLARLDTLLAGQGPTYIKMDIEGAEFDALLGARETIQRTMPVLAICVYHQQDHLWKIPLLINSLSPHYRFLLRTYLPGRLETVCYAVPKNRLTNQPA